MAPHVAEAEYLPTISQFMARTWGVSLLTMVLSSVLCSVSSTASVAVHLPFVNLIFMPDAARAYAVFHPYFPSNIYLVLCTENDYYYRRLTRGDADYRHILSTPHAAR
jgi:hypothetical protein